MSDSINTTTENPFKDAETPSELLGQLAGAASTCWGDLDKAGVFESRTASRFVDAALDRLIELGWTVEAEQPPISMDGDPEFWHGLTMWTGAISAQIRDHGLVIHPMEGGPTEQGDPSLSKDDARKLRDLLNVATARGFL